MAFYYEIYILLTHHLACEMNVHKRCEQSGCIPKLCGADHTEKRGRIQVKIFFEPKSKDEGRLTVESKILLLFKTPYVSVCVTEQHVRSRIFTRL